MDQIRTGSLIRRLRLEQGMAQLALASTSEDRAMPTAM